jgi:hypothetical protein
VAHRYQKVHIRPAYTHNCHLSMSSTVAPRLVSMHGINYICIYIKLNLIIFNIFIYILGTFKKWQKATISFIMSIHIELSCHWVDFHEIWYLSIFLKICWENQVSLHSDKNNNYFIWRPVRIFDHISLISSWTEECFRVDKIKHIHFTFYVQLLFLKNHAICKMWKSHRWQCGACAYDHFLWQINWLIL